MIVLMTMLNFQGSCWVLNFHHGRYSPACNPLLAFISCLYDMQENTVVQFYSPRNCRGTCVLTLLSYVSTPLSARCCVSTLLSAGPCFYPIVCRSYVFTLLSARSYVSCLFSTACYVCTPLSVQFMFLPRCLSGVMFLPTSGNRVILEIMFIDYQYTMVAVVL